MAAEAPPTAELGGYDYNFVEPPQDRYLCKICHVPSRDPYLTECCGTILCKSCLDRAKQATTVSTACPSCRKENFATMINKHLDREIRSLHIYCTNKEKGCEWQSELNDINNHLGNSDGCQFEEVKCSNECGKMIQRQYLTSHVETECPRRKVNCQYCHDTGEHQFIEGQHKEECPKLPLPCPNKCEVGNVPLEDIETHLISCGYEMIQCEYYSVGCEVRMARKDQEKHYEEKMEGHLKMTQAKLAEFEIKLSTVKTEAEEKIAGLTRVTRSLNQRLVASEQTLDTVQAQLFAEFKEMQDKQQREMQHKQQEMQDKQQEKINKLETMLNAERTKQWLFRLHTMSITGDKICPVIVKVSGFEDKKMNKTKWHSDPFYTHDKGYRMCLRILINGVGNGEGTHVSVFLYLMKGQYDGNLKWPLVGSFEIELLNQKKDGGHHTTKPIKFSEGAPSARRVSSKQPDEMANEGLGRNEFISHEKIKKESDDCQYLKNDCIFFRIPKLEH